MTYHHQSKPLLHHNITTFVILNHTTSHPIKSTSAKGPKKVQRTTQTRNVHFDRRRPQTLELRRYIFYSKYSNLLIIIKDVLETFIIMYSNFRLSSLASKMSDSSENPYSQNGRSYKTRNNRHGLDANDADLNGR